MTGKRAIAIQWGAASPLSLELPARAILGEWRGPEGVRGRVAGDMVREALDAPVDVPALSSHVVAGDRVAIAISGNLAEEHAVVAAVTDAVVRGGVAEADITRLRSAEFVAAEDGRTSYLAADAVAEPIYLARELVDADAVIAVGEWNWDASLAGRSIEGELWPAFSRRSSRESLVRRLASRPKSTLEGWRAAVEQVTWQLGLLASLRIVPGTNDSLAAAVFGSPPGSRRASREVAAAWRPTVRGAAELSIASLRETSSAGAGDTARDGHPGFEQLVRGVAAAARITASDGTICVASSLHEPPGPVFTRWRQGAPLQPLLREAIAGGDPMVVADAFLTRRFDRALGTRRLVLLSGLDQELVEDLGFGHAASPETVERLAKRTDTVAVLHEADRMLPSVHP